MDNFDYMKLQRLISLLKVAKIYDQVMDHFIYCPEMPHGLWEKTIMIDERIWVKTLHLPNFQD